jgi:aldose 1-epimerase
MIMEHNSAQAANPQHVSVAAWGKTSHGEAVKLYTLTNIHGMVAKVTDYGATLVELHVPGKDGKLDDVVLGFDNVQGYESADNQYFGSTTGRVANRIANGEFTINGMKYQVPKNGDNSLHGGLKRSLDRVMWKGELVESKAGLAVTFAYTSPDGEEGFPGNLVIHVTYTLTDKNELRIDYLATTDMTTPVNLTNHSYFNLTAAGATTVQDHIVQIEADQYTPVNDKMIPTGALENVAGTPVDLREPKKLSDNMDALDKTSATGYDHNYVVRGQAGELRLAAIVKSPVSGRVMHVYTTEPGIQLYTGNFLKNQTGKNGQVYHRRSALCLEAQHYPDSVNQPKFPTTLIDPKHAYSQITVYQFSVE